MFAPWVSICSFHRHVVGLFRARSRQRLVLKRLNSAVAEAGSMDWRYAFAKGGCRDVRPAAQYLSLASPPARRPRERHQREGDPAVRDPFGATCGARFRRGPRKLAWRLKQRAALLRLKLCSSARPEGKGAGQPFGPSLRSASASEVPGMVGAARVLCHSCLRRRIQVLDDERLLPAMSRRWWYQDAGSQR